MAHEITSLWSASIASHVHVSPASGGAFFACLTFFSFAYVNDQISSACTRRVFRRLRTCSSWNAAHASPATTSSLVTVLIDTPVTRSTDRSDMPSTSRSIRCARLAVLSLFIML